MTLARQLARDGVGPAEPVALVLGEQGVVLAWGCGHRAVATRDPAGPVAELAALDPRWIWWSARVTAAPLVARDVRPRICWDLAAVARFLHGVRREDPAAVWAAAHSLPEPEAPRGELDLFDLRDEQGGPLRADGQLSREWAAGSWSKSLDAGLRWARLAFEVFLLQREELDSLPDPRPAARPPGLAMLSAHAESAAALLATELEHDGLPVDRDAASRLLGAAIGPRPVDAAAADAARDVRDSSVRQHFPDQTVDLRNPAQVRSLLARIGLDLPDTRSWRLRPHADTLPAVASLLAWRKAERIATTYGWSWLEGNVAADGRLRGRWGSADAAAGRMTAGAGLHNLPVELRPMVRAEPGHRLVRADLGQIEPRVLATVSGDRALAAAAAQPDMYAPVADLLRCDRPTAKVAVLAAMYGQTSGTAGTALADMERAYPTAVAFLRRAEDAGRDGRAVRTYGGRLLTAHLGDSSLGLRARGRFVRNAVIQGAAAELFKAWAATVRDGLPAVDGQLVLCLHDELLVHVPTEHAEQVRALLEASLESTASWWAAGSGVHFVADVRIAATWADAH